MWPANWWIPDLWKILSLKQNPVISGGDISGSALRGMTAGGLAPWRKERVSHSSHSSCWRGVLNWIDFIWLHSTIGKKTHHECSGWKHTSKSSQPEMAEKKHQISMESMDQGYTLLVDIGTQTGLSARERGSIKFVSAAPWRRSHKNGGGGIVVETLP